jgi:hypothetical protein
VCSQLSELLLCLCRCLRFLLGRLKLGMGLGECVLLRVLMRVRMLVVARLAHNTHCHVCRLSGAVQIEAFFKNEISVLLQSVCRLGQVEGWWRDATPTPESTATVAVVAARQVRRRRRIGADY